MKKKKLTSWQQAVKQDYANHPGDGIKFVTGDAKYNRIKAIQKKIDGGMKRYLKEEHTVPIISIPYREKPLKINTNKSQVTKDTKIITRDGKSFKITKEDEKNIDKRKNRVKVTDNITIHRTGKPPKSYTTTRTTVKH